jgi:hypothetical protein
MRMFFSFCVSADNRETNAHGQNLIYACGFQTNFGGAGEEMRNKEGWRELRFLS